MTEAIKKVLNWYSLPVVYFVSYTREDMTIHTFKLCRMKRRYDRSTQLNYTHNISNCESNFFQPFVHDCIDQSYLYIILCSSNIWIFIYCLVFFTFYGYVTNSQRAMLVGAGKGLNERENCRVNRLNVFCVCKKIAPVLRAGLTTSTLSKDIRIA